MKLEGFTFPCIVDAEAHFGAEFMIRAIIRPDYTAEKQIIFTKRIPDSSGNRPGIILMQRGSTIQLWTFGDGDEKWTVARTGRGYLQAAQTYEILVTRSKDKVKIYIDNIERTHPEHCSASPGDLNNDCPIVIGVHGYDRQLKHRYHGQIKAIELYNFIEINTKKDSLEWRKKLNDPIRRRPLAFV